MGAWTHSYTPATYYGTAYLRAYWAGVQMSVSGGAWSLSWTSFAVYLSLNGGAETEVFSSGAGSLSGTVYQECLNLTSLSPIAGVDGACTGPGLMTCDPLPVAATWGLAVTGAGGYQWGPPGELQPDPITLDASAASGSCSCTADLPTIGGTNSYNVLVGVTYTGTKGIDSELPTTCGYEPPDICHTVFNEWVLSAAWAATSAGIKANNVLVAAQSLSDWWECGLNPGSESSGSSTSPLPSETTYCLTDRIVSNYNATVWCMAAGKPCICTGVYTPPAPASSACCFTASASVACTSPPPSGEVLDYDVSQPFRHGRVFYNPGTSTLWTGYSPNGNPYAWADKDSSLNIQRAACRWKDNGNTPFGILYDGGSGNLLFIDTPDEGNTFTSPMTIASTLASGGFFDFDEVGDFNRWFIWQEGSSAPYTLYMCVLDRQGNVIVPRTATNVTNADLAPIRLKWSPVTGGGLRYCLLYSVSGVLTFLCSRNGQVFS